LSKRGKQTEEFTLYMDIEFEITYTTPPDTTLVDLAAKKCAESGLTADLTADTLDLVLAYDNLLAVRFLY
jgi:hypothetical protein